MQKFPSFLFCIDITMVEIANMKTTHVSKPMNCCLNFLRYLCIYSRYVRQMIAGPLIIPCSFFIPSVLSIFIKTDPSTCKYLSEHTRPIGFQTVRRESATKYKSMPQSHLHSSASELSPSSRSGIMS